MLLLLFSIIHFSLSSWFLKQVGFLSFLLNMQLTLFHPMTLLSSDSGSAVLDKAASWECFSVYVIAQIQIWCSQASFILSHFNYLFSIRQLNLRAKRIAYCWNNLRVQNRAGDGSVVKSTGCSPEGLGLSPSSYTWWLITVWISILGALMPSSVFCGQACKWYIDICAGKTHLHIK